MNYFNKNSPTINNMKKFIYTCIYIIQIIHIKMVKLAYYKKATLKHKIPNFFSQSITCSDCRVCINRKIAKLQVNNLSAAISTLCRYHVEQLVETRAQPMFSLVKNTCSKTKPMCGNFSLNGDSNWLRFLPALCPDLCLQGKLECAKLAKWTVKARQALENIMTNGQLKQDWHSEITQGPHHPPLTPVARQLAKSSKGRLEPSM